MGAKAKPQPAFIYNAPGKLLILQAQAGHIKPHQEGSLVLCIFDLFHTGIDKMTDISGIFLQIMNLLLQPGFSVFICCLGCSKSEYVLAFHPGILKHLADPFPVLCTGNDDAGCIQSCQAKGLSGRDVHGNPVLQKLSLL